ncbi:MAG: parallel beta-helix domain-containing protein [Myxococcota bacterium]
MLRTLAATLFLALPASAGAATHTVAPGESIQDAVNAAQPGDTVLVAPGRYTQSVYIDKPRLTLEGKREGEAWAVLDGELKLNDGIISSGHSTVIKGFHVKGYKGNGIMTQGANNFQILDNRVEGAFYGIFPQFGTNGLVRANVVSGSEDAGIYVGMSDNIELRGNTCFGNVMGFEFENTRNAFAEGNHIYGNTTGIALTIVPGLPIKDAKGIVLKDNKIENNNLENFAPKSSIASQVPSGVGILVVGPDEVSIEGNTMTGHDNTAVFVADLTTFGLATDPRVDPYSDGVHVLRNTFEGNGDKMSGMLGDFLAPTGKSGLEVLVMSKGRGSCLAKSPGVDALGVKRWSECKPSDSVAKVTTVAIEGGAKEPVYTAEQRGRLTYLAVCTGCHAYDSVLHGPSMQAIKALYETNPAGLVAYARAPVKKRKDFPEMPPQAYLGEETLGAIARYILEDLGASPAP